MKTVPNRSVGHDRPTSFFFWLFFFVVVVFFWCWWRGASSLRSETVGHGFFSIKNNSSQPKMRYVTSERYRKLFVKRFRVFFLLLSRKIPSNSIRFFVFRMWPAPDRRGFFFWVLLRPSKREQQKKRNLFSFFFLGSNYSKRWKSIGDGSWSQSSGQDGRGIVKMGQKVSQIDDMAAETNENCWTKKWKQQRKPSKTR